jgi:uncharacterized protein (DUF305 family)
METKNYRKFGLMISISFVIMYTVMYLNVAELDHVYLSLTRTYMTLLMITPMAWVMLLMMPMMYKNRRWNNIILVSSLLLFVLSLTCLRNQTAIGDKQYMKAMIPHHSSAILTSENADIQDPEVKKLADEIIKTQIEEIEQMKNLLQSLDQ